jgi:hypothetical protein
MKHLTPLILVGLTSWGSQAQSITSTLSQRLVTLTVEVNAKNLRWSQADYQFPVVKVLVPELAEATILDHRNTGEGAPCLASYVALTPEDVIQNYPSVEKIPFEITLQKVATLDPIAKTCGIVLIEDIKGNIRGYEFIHSRRQTINFRNLADCR